MQKIIPVLVLFVTLAFSSHLKADGYSHGLGSGIQFGGVIGWQGAGIKGANKIRMGLGYTGIALGYDRFVLPKMSLGIQTFGNQYRIGYGFSVNYHIGTELTTGWILGLDLYRGIETGEGLFDLITSMFELVIDTDETFDELGIDDGPEYGAFVSVGYLF